jgi:heme/copper-type cytochrome/quinol oxidase subunit 2
MPIAIRVVEKNVFDQWIAAVKADKLEDAKKILAATESDPETKKVAKAGAGAKTN